MIGYEECDDNKMSGVIDSQNKRPSLFVEPQIDLSIYRKELDEMAKVVQECENNFDMENNRSAQLAEYNKKLDEAGIEKVFKYIEECVEESRLISNRRLQDWIDATNEERKQKEQGWDE